MDKYYHELKLKISPNYKDLFVQLAFELGCEAVEEKEGLIIIRSCDDLQDFKFAFDTMQESLKLDTYWLELCVKENKDWIQEYKNSVQPIQVDNLYIHTSWQEAKNELINIIIDPALAFGSGHHPSTNACLKLLQKYMKKGFSVADIGCGSGILAISAAKLGGLVDACDIDEQALNSTLKNAMINEVKLNDCWLGSAKDSTKTYDLVLVNIIADIISLLRVDIKKLVKKGGILILSGLINEKVDLIKEAFKEYELTDCIKDDEWTSLSFKG